MTFKEKLQKEHPEAVANWARGGCIGCPSTYGYETKDRNRCPQTPECWTKENCTTCWNREIPGTEHKDGKWPKENPHLADVHEPVMVARKSHPLDGLSAKLFSIDEMHEWPIRSVPKINMPGIKQVIFNDPATIVIWADGEKTVVKCQNGEPYDPEKGLAMAITKRALGNKGNYFDEIKKWTSKYEPKGETEQLTIKMDASGVNLEATFDGLKRAGDAAVNASKRLFRLGEV